MTGREKVVFNPTGFCRTNEQFSKSDKNRRQDTKYGMEVDTIRTRQSVSRNVRAPRCQEQQVESTSGQRSSKLWSKLLEISPSFRRQEGIVVPENHLDDCRSALNMIAQGIGNGTIKTFTELCEAITALKCSLQDADSGTNNDKLTSVVDDISISNGMLWIIDDELNSALSAAHNSYTTSEATIADIVLLKGQLNQAFRDLVILSNQKASQESLVATLAAVTSSAMDHTQRVVSAIRDLIAAPLDEQAILYTHECTLFQEICTNLLECYWKLCDSASVVVGVKDSVQDFGTRINTILDGIEKAAYLLQNPFTKPMNVDLAVTIRDNRISGTTYPEIASQVSKMSAKSRESHLLLFKGAITDDNKTSSGVLLCLAARQVLSELSSSEDYVWKGSNTTGCLISFIADGETDVKKLFST